MKNRKMLSGIAGLIGIVSLCSCSLAVPEAGVDGEGDRLIGVFITSDYLDLFDIDAYFEKNMSGIVNQKEITAADASKYEEKLYATIDKSGGKDSKDWEVSFGDVKGINFFSPVWKDKDGEKYWDNISDEGVCDTDIQVNTSDTEEEHSLSGTIYILPGQADKDDACFVNPVYQTADGKIYAVSGQGYSTSGESSEGEHFSTTLSADTTTNEGGKTKTEKGSVTVSISTMHKPVKITLHQMDKGNQIVKTEEYKPGNLPEKITPEKKAEYLIVETEKETLSGKKEVSREIYDNKEEDNALETFYALDSGIISKQETEIVWDTP